MTRRAKIYTAVSALVLVLLVLVFARSCRMGNDPQSLDDTVGNEEVLSPEDDTTGIRQSEL